MSNIKDKARNINKNIGALFIAMRHDDTPLYAKLACLMAVGYALSPIDLIPDFIPVLGYLDDLLILPFLIWLSVKLVPKEIFSQCLEQSDGMVKSGGNEKFFYALPIVFIWAFIIYKIASAFIK